MIFAALLLAAIVTERNDTHVIPPNYATFRGTSAAPGIESCWIPYGTYTGGEGDTEYLRVTSNLTGVVASAIGGFVERSDCAYGTYRLEAPQHRWLTYPYPLGYRHVFTNEVDFAEFLTTNNSLRIIDVLNRFESFQYVVTNPGIYSVYSDSIYYRATGSGNGSMEDGFAWMDAGFDIIDDERHYRQIHDGVVSKFGGRQLESLAGGGAAIEPPIGTSWTTSLPFRAEDTNLWVAVWPTYAAVTNDTHFFVEIDSTNPVHDVQFKRDSLRLWMLASHLLSPQDKPIWGEDVWGDEGDGAANDLLAALLHRPLPYNMEDVLSVDTGWKYEVPPAPALTNDYWTIGGERLDRAYIIGDWDDIPGSSWASWRGTNYYPYLEWNGDWLRWELWYEFGSAAFEYSPDVYPETLDFGPHGVARRTMMWSEVDTHGYVDDYTHWRNGTTRLDWKRLGLICQLERQMEITYKAKTAEDYLPYVSKFCAKGKSWRGEVEVDLTAATNEIDLADVSWTFVTNTMSITTNATGWSFPTARAPAPSLHGGVTGSGSGGTIYLTKDDFQSMLENCDGLENVPDGTNLLLRADVQNFSVSDSPPGISLDLYYFSVGLESMNCRLNPFLIPFGDDATNATIALYRGVDKEVHATWTYSNAGMTPEIKSRFAAYPDANTWSNNYVAAQTRPTLDFMLSATGITAGDYLYFSTNRTEIPAVAWDHIPAHTSNFTTNRYWRMNPVCAEESTRSDSDVNRHNMLIDLNNSVAAKFKNHTTFDVNNVEGRATITQNEETRICGELDNKTVAIHAVIAPWFNWTDGRSDLWDFGAKMEARFDLVNGVVTNFVPLNVHLEGSVEEYVDITYSYADENGDIAIGSFHWEVEEVTVGETNAYQSVIVDGHQDQMIKTVWRFKNLRDPNL